MVNSLLILSFDYPPNDGGIARLCAEIAMGFACDGQQIKVLSQKYSGGETLPESLKRIETIRLKPERPLREWLAYRFLKRSNSQELCISGIWYPEGLIAMLARKNPHIILAHGAELFPPKQLWRQRLWRWLQRRVLESADLVITNSQFTASLVHKVAPQAHVIPIPLGVDAQFFKPFNDRASREKWSIDNEKRVICSVSRLHAFKGHDTVLHAIAMLPADEKEQILYLIAGKGPALQSLKHQAMVLGIEQQVRWLGFVSDDDLPSLYNASDLFILATRELPHEQSVEGFGLVFLEAQACGTPVVGTRTGGIPDAIVEGRGGWLIEQDDVDALTGILHKLIIDPKSFASMGQIARQRVESECTWEHYIEKLYLAFADAGIQEDIAQIDKGLS